MLPRLSAISAVSGASIAAATLGLRWAQLGFDARGVAIRFTDQVVAPLLAIASRTMDVAHVLLGALLDKGGSSAFVRPLRERSFGSATLRELPETPKFTICAADLTSGLPWIFDRDGMGWVGRPRWSQTPEIAVAVTASLLAPPLASMRLALAERPDQQGPKEVALADGVLVDRFGLEPVWDRYRTIYVSDGSPQTKPADEGSGGYMQHFSRALQLLDGQGRRIWKRLLINSFRRGDRQGAYWGIETDVESVGLDDPLVFPNKVRDALANLPARYAELDPRVQRQLINWGFVVADTMLRRHGDGTVQRPAVLPYADVALPG